MNRLALLLLLLASCRSSAPDSDQLALTESYSRWVDAGHGSAYATLEETKPTGHEITKLLDGWLSVNQSREVVSWQVVQSDMSASLVIVYR